jgi:hypothetical protein
VPNSIEFIEPPSPQGYFGFTSHLLLQPDTRKIHIGTYYADEINIRPSQALLRIQPPADAKGHSGHWYLLVHISISMFQLQPDDEFVAIADMGIIHGEKYIYQYMSRSVARQLVAELT